MAIKLDDTVRYITEHPGFDGVCLNVWALKVISAALWCL